MWEGIRDSWIEPQLDSKGSYLEELHGWAASLGTVTDYCLISQVIEIFYRDKWPADGQHGGQVGRIGADYDEGEDPPSSTE